MAAMLRARTPPDRPRASPVAARVESRRAGTLRFNVTIADTAERQARGLMVVRALDPDEGMWFPQRPPRVMQMWMKNTLIPLDVLFADGLVVRHADAAIDAMIHCPERVAACSRSVVAATDGISVGSTSNLARRVRPMHQQRRTLNAACGYTSR
jgi:uncharacterized membrane protein (UPF0127 family)